MIPKIIHYCWFGKNPLPTLTKKCIESWKKYCPDYQIIEWNEDNFDVNANRYVKEAYEAKKWAFVSDVARLHAMVNYGGIYMDTDMEVIKSLDELLTLQAVTGFESGELVAAGIMACEKNDPFFVEFLKSYENDAFIKEDGSMNLNTNVTRLTELCKKYGLQFNNEKQTVNGCTVFPSDYFYPKSWDSSKVNLTENTYTIHHYDGSWLPKDRKFVQWVARVFGKKFLGFLVRVKHFFKGKRA